MKILYGTTNRAKLQAMNKSVEGLDIELIGLNDLDCELPVIDENGKNPLENAEIKARAYYEAFHMPVFSCDSGLCFDELKEEDQHYSSMDISIATEPFILVTKPHEKRVKGFPLDSSSVDIESGKYYYDLDVKDVSTSVDDGVREFFKESLIILE